MGRKRKISRTQYARRRVILRMAEPRLLAMLLQGDELFHGQIGEACFS